MSKQDTITMLENAAQKINKHIFNTNPSGSSFGILVLTDSVTKPKAVMSNSYENPETHYITYRGNVSYFDRESDILFDADAK